MNISHELVDRLAVAQRIVAFSGAGASAESGIPTFRDPDGIWSQFAPGELASMEGFHRDPVRVQSWYAARRATVEASLPNAGHLAVAELEELVPNVTVVTQNVDGLHQKAGSTRVVELHGSLLTARCAQCGSSGSPLSTSPSDTAAQFCECGGLMRPDVVWFGEQLPYDELQQAMMEAARSDILFTIGTGAEVYPASGLPLTAADNGAYIVEVNIRPTAITRFVDEVITGPAGEVLPELVSRLKTALTADATPKPGGATI